MLADILLALSGATFFMVLLDVLLSEGQKKKLTEWLTVVWYYADRIRQVDPVLAIFRNKYVQVALMFCILIPLIMAVTYLVWDLREFTGIEVILTAFAIAVVLYGRRALTFVLSPAAGWKGIALRLGLLLLFSTLALSLFFRSLYYGIFIAAVTGYVVFFTMLFFVGPVVLVAVTTILLTIFELGIRRIAEYPKGPIIAGSALIAGLSALFKAFG